MVNKRAKNACIKKNNLYLAFLKDRSKLTESRNKKYKNKLTKLLRLEKKNYYRKKLEDCKTNTRETWKILNNIIGKRKSETKYSNEFCVGENLVVLESKDIANHFNKFFVDIGTNLSNLIEPCPGTKPTDFVESNVITVNVYTPKKYLTLCLGAKVKLHTDTMRSA